MRWTEEDGDVVARWPLWGGGSRGTRACAYGARKGGGCSPRDSRQQAAPICLWPTTTCFECARPIDRGAMDPQKTFVTGRRRRRASFAFPSPRHVRVPPPTDPRRSMYFNHVYYYYNYYYDLMLFPKLSRAHSESRFARSWPQRATTSNARRSDPTEKAKLTRPLALCTRTGKARNRVLTATRELCAVQECGQRVRCGIRNRVHSDIVLPERQKRLLSKRRSL